MRQLPPPYIDASVLSVTTIRDRPKPTWDLEVDLPSVFTVIGWTIVLALTWVGLVINWLYWIGCKIYDFANPY